MTDKIAEVIEKMNANLEKCVNELGFDKDLEELLYDLQDQHADFYKCYINNEPYEGEIRKKLEQGLAIYFSPLAQALR